MSKLLSNGLKIQFNLNERIVRGLNGEVAVIELRNGNLYEINFNNVHKANVVDLVQSWRRDNALEL